jgi:putative methionine-R-sulfoxide reductase with GAF domain
MKLKFNLSNRISLGYFFIIVVAVVATLFCIATLRSNQKLDTRIQDTYQPLYLLLKDFNTLLGNSQKLSNNWVYQPNAAEKQQLKTIHETEVPALKENLDSILKETDETSLADLQSLMIQFNGILNAQKELMTILSVDSLYSNDQAVDGAIKLLDAKITPSSIALSKLLVDGFQLQEKRITEAQEAKQRSYTLLTWLLVVMILLFVVAAVAAYLYSNKSVVRPIGQLKNVILDIGKGKVVQAQFEKRSDEIGEMTQAITSLMQGINAKSEFALQIGKGNYAEDFKLISEDDAMGKALLDMRENLKQNAEEERKRNWATQGLAEIGSLLRVQSASVEELYVNIIRFAVNYTKSNQGGLFLLDSEQKDNEHLKLVACYAYEKRKYQDKIVAIGEGLVGQCVLEKQIIYMVDIPKNYIRITSGLGDATPGSLLIVPLKINEQVHGVMELASFNKFEEHEIKFVEKLAENIAGAISTVLVNERTRLLLESTQQQTEEMKSQEEEMRQNMEELSATQEEMARKEQEYLAKIKYLEGQQNKLVANAATNIPDNYRSLAVAGLFVFQAHYLYPCLFYIQSSSFYLTLAFEK